MMTVAEVLLYVFVTLPIGSVTKTTEKNNSRTKILRKKAYFVSDLANVTK